MKTDRPGGSTTEITTGLQAVSRRRFLRWGLRALGGDAALVSVAGGSLFALRGCAPDIAGLRVLSDHQYRTLTALARALIPAGGPFPRGASDIEMARAFDSYLADEPEDIQDDLGLALTLLEYGPVLYDLRLATFSHLGENERRIHFEGWMASDDLTRRMVATAFRKFVLLVFYDQPAVWPHIGYEESAS